MSKNQQRRRSIQDIIPPARSKPIRMVERSPEKSSPAELENSHVPPSPPGRGHPLKSTSGYKKDRNVLGLVTIALAIVLIIGGAFAVVSTVFYRANIAIEIQTFSVPVAETFNASLDGVLLSYVDTTFEKTLSKTVPKTGSEFVEDRASGTITIFNEHSAQSQRLITNTRFETPSGLIFRVKNPVVVPGYTTENGKIVPGSIEVTVYADDPGDEYNISATSFTIPGLKGSPQFDAMYARSSQSMVGGFIGEKAVVNESVRDAAVAEIKSQLQNELPAEFKNNLPEGNIYFNETLDVTFSEQPDRTTNEGAIVSVKGVAKAPTFSNEKLARIIATEGGVTYESDLRIVNIEELALSLVRADDTENLQLTISGEAHLEGVYDMNQLVQDLAGKDRKNIGIVLSGYPAIKDMQVSVYPFWRTKIPENTARVIIHTAE